MTAILGTIALGIALLAWLAVTSLVETAIKIAYNALKELVK